MGSLPSKPGSEFTPDPVILTDSWARRALDLPHSHQEQLPEAGGRAGGLGPEGRRVGDQDCGGSEQRRSRWEVARPLGRDRTGPRQGREPGAPWRSQPHSNQGFFPRLAPALPSCLPFPPVNKYLPGSEPRVLVRDGSTSWSIKTALLSPRCAQDMGRSHFSSKKET